MTAAEEEGPLLVLEERRPRSRSLVGALSLVLASLVLGAVALVRPSQDRDRLPGAVLDAKVGETSECSTIQWPSTATDAWTVYKYTIPVTQGTGPVANELMATYLTGKLATSSAALGCNGTKYVNTVASMPIVVTDGSISAFSMELHLVDAAQLSTGSITMHDWQTYFEGLNGDMTLFNRFMDNKVQMFVPSLGDFQELVEADGVDYLGRLSGEENEFAHMLVQVAGRIYELVGPARTLADSSKFSSWSASECAGAQALSMSLEEYLGMYERLNSGKATFEAKGFTLYRPMPVSVHVATDSIQQQSQLTEDLHDVSSASTVTYDAGSCAYSTTTWDSMPLFTARYVANPQATEGQYTVAFFEAYVAEQHQAMVPGGFDWDHFLDNHVGMENLGAKGSSLCGGLVDDLKSHLDSCHVPAGYRGNSFSSHFYTGYPGSSLTWEYYLYCSPGDSPEFVNICTCLPENNNKLFEEMSGDRECLFD